MSADDDVPFHKSSDVPDANIWASDDEDGEAQADQNDVPAFLRRFRRKKT